MEHGTPRVTRSERRGVAAPSPCPSRRRPGPARRGPAAAAALLLALTAGCAHADAAAADAGRARLEARQAEFFAALAARDVDRTAALFAESAVLHVAGMPAVEGRAAIRAFYGNLFGFLSASSAVPGALHLAASGDLAYGTGTAANVFRRPTGSVEYRGKYALVWRRLEGDWRIALYAVTSDQPEAAQRPIRIGATMSLTGTLATQGVPAANGYRLCIRDANARGGLLGRPLQLVLHDDGSDPRAATALYERLIAEERVDAVLGPYGSTLTEAVAPVTERHRHVMIAPLAATSSIWEQGHRYLFMVLPPAELFLAGLIDLAAERGLERVAILQQDALFPRAAGAGAAERARERGLDVVLHATYPSGTTDFAPLLEQVRAADAQVLAMAASALGDFVAVVRRMRELEVDVAMFGTSGAVAEFQQALGDAAEYTYGLSAWEPGLPYPGSADFVAAYRRDFGRTPSFHAAGAYGSCQLFMEAATRAGTLEADALRAALLALETRTVFGDFAVDARGYQTAHRGLFIQWQDGEKVVVWPPEAATAGPRFPAPPWRRR
jgi:branched-chain amino acid transport system substrate-binding protein